MGISYFMASANWNRIYKKHYDFQKSMDNYYYLLKGKAYSAAYDVLLVLL